MVNDDGKGLAAAAVYFFGARLQEVLRPAGDVDLGPAGAQVKGDAAADALCGPGDQANLVL